MASGQRSTWPIVLFLGLCISLLVGSAAAVAVPSENGRPWWHDDRPQRVTGTVLEVDRAEGVVVLDGLVSYDPVQAGIGTLTVEVAELGSVRPDDTVDAEVTRHGGRWRADELILLDTD